MSEINNMKRAKNTQQLRKIKSPSVKCVHCQEDMNITPPYNVNWVSESWIECPNIKCKRPNKFNFLKGGNISLVNITKFATVDNFRKSKGTDGKELVDLMKEVEDSNIHDRYYGAAIVLRVCLEHFVWVRTLMKPVSDVKVNHSVLTELKSCMGSNGFNQKEIEASEKAFNYILDLGDTAAHYELRDIKRKKLPTKASVELGISKFDELSKIISRW